MGRASTKQQRNSFVRGKISKGSEFNAPEDAVRDMLNMEISDTGEALRRRSATLESTGALASITGTYASDRVNVVQWADAGQDRDVDLVAAQVGKWLLVWKKDQTTMTGGFLLKLDVTTVGTGIASSYASRVWDMVRGSDGALYLFTGVNHPLSIIYNFGTSFTNLELNLKVRDTVGITNLSQPKVDANPATLTPAHNYNLQNQGWSSTDIAAYFTANAVYPSNAQQWFQGRDASNNFSPAELDKLDFGTAPAPRGRFLLDLLVKDRNAIVSGAGTDGVPVGPTVGEFYAGRMWVGGMVTSVNRTFAHTVWYSQSITGTLNEQGFDPKESLYPVNDLTSEFFNSPLATDGGGVTIPDAGSILRMKVLSTNLILFSTSGIYALNGGFGRAFEAQDFTTSKISNIVINNKLSLVSTGDAIYFFADEGVQVVSIGESAGTFSISNLTETKWSLELYQELLSNAAGSARGQYTNRENKIHWTYNNNSAIGGSEEHNRILILDLDTSAFVDHDLGSKAGTPLKWSVIGASTQDNPGEKRESIKFLSRIQSGTDHKYEWMSFKGDSFLDWGVDDYESSILTWPTHMGDPSVVKQSTFVVAYFNMTEENWIDNGSGGAILDKPSGCKAQARWDWNVTATGNKWSRTQQLYRFNRPLVAGVTLPDPIDTGESIVYTKTRFRGYGKSFQLHFAAELGKDMQILGWTIPITSTTVT